jgi:hypothetical protein
VSPHLPARAPRRLRTLASLAVVRESEALSSSRDGGAVLNDSTERGARALPGLGTGQPTRRSPAGSASRGPDGPSGARPGEGQGRSARETVYSLAESKGERAQRGPDDVSTAATEGSEERNESRPPERARAS